MKIGNFDWLQDEKGNWLWKANSSLFQKNKKKLKAKYHDLPWFRATNVIEQNTKEDFRVMLKSAILEIGKEINNGK